MKYKNAPIKEAIFDVKIDSLQNSDLNQIELIHESIKSRFPNKRKKIVLRGSIALQENNPVKSEGNANVIGYIFSNEENNRIAQFSLDGFTYNMLAPYTDWEEFSKEAFYFWNIYNLNFKPNKITRIALRYINKISLPYPLVNFEDYIINIPPIPKCLPQTLSHFFMQTTIPYEQNDETKVNVNISETIEKISEQTVPFILDIDVTQTFLEQISEEELENNFNKLRHIKNEIFEHIITDNTRKLIE